jgi:hypothetical protein
VLLLSMPYILSRNIVLLLKTYYHLVQVCLRSQLACLVHMSMTKGNTVLSSLMISIHIGIGIERVQSSQFLNPSGCYDGTKLPGRLRTQTGSSLDLSIKPLVELNQYVLYAEARDIQWQAGTCPNKLYTAIAESNRQAQEEGLSQASLALQVLENLYTPVGQALAPITFVLFILLVPQVSQPIVQLGS